MASNVEGEALKRMSGAASQGGGLSALTGWLAGRGQRDKGGSGSSGKSGIDYQNEERAKQLDFERETQRFDAVLGGLDTRPHMETINRTTTQTSAKQRTVPRPSSSGGQGTSGNKKGGQFKQTVRKTGKEIAGSVGGAVLGGVTTAITKNPKVAAVAAKVGENATNAFIDKVSTRKSGRPSMPSVDSMTPSPSTNTAADLSISTARKPRASGKPKA